MNIAPDALVVAIGVDGASAAVQYAVSEARRTGRPIHLVHVLQIPAVQAYAGVYGAAVDATQAVLDEALARAAQLAGDDVAITGELMDDGWVVDDLVRRTQADQVLILQHRTFSAVHRLYTGSIVQAVASRAHVPVVSVPEAGGQALDGGDRGRAGPRRGTRAAADRLRGGPRPVADLVVLHAWWLSSGYDVAVVDQAMRTEWAERSRAQLEPALEVLQAEFPDVTVSVEVRHAPPIEAILDAAAASALTVIGRRHHRLPLGSHLGPVVRATIAHASSPVLITPELSMPAKRAVEPSRPYRSGALAAHS